MTTGKVILPTEPYDSPYYNLVASPIRSDLSQDSFLQMNWKVSVWVGNVNYVTSTAFKSVWEHTLTFIILESYAFHKLPSTKWLSILCCFQTVFIEGNFLFVLYLNSWWCKGHIYKVKVINISKGELANINWQILPIESEYYDQN